MMSEKERQDGIDYIDGVLKDLQREHRVERGMAIFYLVTCISSLAFVIYLLLEALG